MKINKYNLSLIFLFFVIYIAFVLSFYGHNFYYSNVDTYERTISLMNLYTQPIFVEVEGREIKLEVFDLKRTQIDVNTSIDLKIKNEKGEVIAEDKSRYFVQAPHLSIHVLAQNKQFCFFAADVTEFYNGTENPQIKNKKNLIDVETSVMYRIINDKIDYVFPGLNSPIGSFKQVEAIYPIDCEDLNNDAKVVEKVLFYKNYNAQDQRNYYYSELKKIEELGI